MKSSEIAKIIKRLDAATGKTFPEQFDGSQRNTYRATIEVAYQLALLNEKLASVIRPWTHRRG
jgi:hypothetical protein